MAMVQGKECGGQISENADACPDFGDVIKEARPKFSLTDLLHRISVPVILSVAGTMIRILSYFSMEGNGKWSRLASSSPTLSTRIRSSSSIASFTLITCSRYAGDNGERLVDRGCECHQRHCQAGRLANDAPVDRAKELPGRAEAASCPIHFEPGSHRDRSRRSTQAI